MNSRFDYAFASGGKLSGLIDRLASGKKSLRYYILLVFALVVVCWLPLAILSLIEHGSQNFYQLFVRDIATHVRFFIAMPLLLLARHSVNKSFNDTVSKFYQSKIVDTDNAQAFEKIIEWVLKWRKALIVDIIFFILVYIMFYIRETATVNNAGFYTPWLMRDHSITVAGWWYTLFALPILQILIYRWLYTIFLWIIFLLKVSRMRLHLSSLHPDGVGGMGFLRYAQLSFLPIAFAFSAMIAAGLNNMMIFSKISIYDFKLLIISALIFTLLIFVLPLLIFVRQLWHIKKKYYMLYSKQAWHVARQYEKELVAFEENGENKPDASWHVDLIGSFEKTDSMSTVLIDKTILISFILAVLLPFVPVVAQEIPLKEILKSLLSKFLG